MDPRLPPPADLDAPVRELVADLAHLVGEADAVDICVDLLVGADPAGHADALPYLAGAPAYALLDGAWRNHWARTWGARGLLHVWRDPAADAVVAGLDDVHVDVRRAAALALERMVVRLDLPGEELP